MVRDTMASEVALRCAESSAIGTEEALGIALDAMEDAVAVLRADGSVAMSNAACRALFDTPLGFEEVLDWWNRELAARGFQGAQSLRYLDARTRSGRVVRVSNRATANGGTVLVFHDRTDDEAALRAARAQLNELKGAKREYIAVLRRELRSSLNSMLGFAQLSQRDVKEPLSKRHQGRLDRILEEGGRLLRYLERSFEDTLYPSANAAAPELPELPIHASSAQSGVRTAFAQLDSPRAHAASAR